MNIFGQLVINVQANLDTVLREQIGYIPAVWINGEVAQAAVGQTIQFPIAPVMTVQDGTAACCDAPLCPPDQNWGVGTMTIDHDRIVNLCWTGEEDRSISNSFNQSGNSMRALQVQQGIRYLVNEVEQSIANCVYNSSQVYTPIGASLFSDQANNFKDLALIRKMMIDAAVPQNDWHLVMNTLGTAGMQNLYNLTRANEAGTDRDLRLGEIGRVFNFGIHESFAAGTPRTAGTGAGYLVNHAGGYAAGAKSIVVDTGTGTILPGDRVTFASVAGVYTVASYATNTITLNQGLQGAVADNAAVTLGAGYGAQAAFKREAIVLAARTPALVGGKDLAVNREYITDPYSGLTFTLSEYARRRATYYELALVWGVKMVKPEMAVLIPS